MIKHKLSTLKEIWLFARERKKYWMLPLVFFFAFLAILIVFSQTSIFAPILYPFL
jgi:hypothetical protein